MYQGMVPRKKPEMNLANKAEIFESKPTLNPNQSLQRSKIEFIKSGQ